MKNVGYRKSFLILLLMISRKFLTNPICIPKGRLIAEIFYRFKSMTFDDGLGQ